MLSPVCGLRPRRDALRRIRKCPNPTILTSSPFSKQRKMMSKTDSTTDDDCRLESPCAATALTRSFLVTVTNHLPLVSTLRDEWRVPLGLECAHDRDRGGAVRIAADADTVERIAAARVARDRHRHGDHGRSRGRGGAATAHLDLEALAVEIFRERD